MEEKQVKAYKGCCWSLLLAAVVLLGWLAYQVIPASFVTWPKVIAALCIATIAVWAWRTK